MKNKHFINQWRQKWKPFEEDSVRLWFFLKRRKLMKNRIIMKKIIEIFLLLVLVSSPALAVENCKHQNNISEIIDTGCKSQKSVGSIVWEYCHSLDVSRVEQEMCMEKRFKEIDKKIQIIFRKTVDELQMDYGDAGKKEAQQTLRDSQQYWVQYRNNQCKVTIGARGAGSAAGEYLLDCLIEKTEERMKELRALQ